MNKEQLDLLQKDFIVCKNYLRKVASTLVDEGISKYPIFVALFDETDIDIGIPILRKEELGTSYTFHASHFEDFTNKNIVIEEKRAAFMENFKDPKLFCCIFVVSYEESNFVFIPYDNEVTWEPTQRELLN